MIYREPDLSPAERATSRLRGLYEQYGYGKYQVSQFEEYSLYLKFKRFLNGGRILSFTDLDGRLLALKPDVTLSIVKNARLVDGPQKVYYIENVYRESLSAGTIQEISQMGLEALGGLPNYTQAEVLSLADQTLASIGPDYVLTVSHMGFLTGLFEALGLEGASARAVTDAIAMKSAHGVEQAAKAAGIGQVGLNLLGSLTQLTGDFAQTVKAARQLCLNVSMTEALGQLEETVQAAGLSDSVRLDFTLQGDLEYYDGLIMAGYLDGVPRAVLSGGRYDGLMKKLGKSGCAVGFALYLDDLKRLPDKRRDKDVDVLILAEDDDQRGLLSAVRSLVDEGLTVRVECAKPNGLRAGRVCAYREGGLTEC